MENSEPQESHEIRFPFAGREVASKIFVSAGVVNSQERYRGAQ
jgi:hypothetical protein